MLTLRAALHVYTQAAQKTAHGLRRSWVTVLFLTGLFVATAAVHELFLAPMRGGVAAGAGMLSLAVAVFGFGLYLGLAQRTVIGGHGPRRKDLQLGAYFWDLVSVAFILWLPSLAVGLFAPQFSWVVMPLLWLLFNPVAEVVYLTRSRSTDALSDAIAFMQNAWPEWLVAQLPTLAAMTAISVLLGGTPLTGLFDALHATGPSFGLLLVGAAAAHGQLNVTALPALLATAAVMHATTLWRGHLFLALSKSNRRQRLWQAKM